GLLILFLWSAPMLQRLLHTSVCRWSMLLLASAALVGIPLPSPTPADTTEIPATVATVQGQPISAEELTAAVKGDLLRLEMERYQVMKQKLDELIAMRLMHLEATKRAIPVEQLEQEEILAKVAPVSPEQVKAFYEANKNRIRQPLEQITPRIEAHLQQQAQQKQQQVFLNELRQRYAVNIALPIPTVHVSTEGEPSLGPTNAAVTIVEFSDFQCPYCRSVQPALKQLLQEYQDRVKLVFRDFPLRNIHPQAQKAAEAAQCAAEQQQFWPYHDKLFAATELQVNELKQYAQDLGLNMQQFTTCLDSDKYAQAVERDLQDGMQAGVSATPSFFVNGQPVSGAVPYERFKELVEAALQQSKDAKRPTP
ncbi:MAG TPA: thioredoxin domain-containing protein, partial [Candidatus Tectomicrobia bacterium]